MPKIVISYRRQDSEAIAGRVRDRLAGHYGAESVFMDIDSIPFGTDFREHIRQVLAQTDIFVAIIGPKWTGARRGRPARIQEETDPVRIEVERALGHGIPVVPILVNGAHMPTPAELPESLHDLSYRNAAEVNAGRDFHQHLDRLIRSMDQILSIAPPGPAQSGEVVPERKAADSAPAPANEFPAEPQPTDNRTASDGAAAPGPGQSARPEKPRWPRRSAMVAAAAVVGAIALGGTYLYLQPPGGDRASIAQPSRSISPPAAGPVATAIDTSCKRPAAAAFYDDFKSPDGGWGQSSDTHFFKDGQMVLQAKTDAATSWIYFPLVFKNIVICSEIIAPPEIKESEADASGGVMFWATDYNNYYVAEIYTNGSYSVWRRLAGKWIEVVPRTPTSSLRQGADAVNQLKISVAINVATLSINGARVVDIWGQPPGRGGAVGLFGQSEKGGSNAWKFSSIAVVDAKEDKRPSGQVLYSETMGTFLKSCKENAAAGFADEFVAPDPGWGGASDTRFVKDGRMVLRPSANTSAWWIFSPMVFKNGVVCADIRSPSQIKSGDGTATGGVIFWASDNRNFYVAQLYVDGSYAIFRKIDGRWASVMTRAKAAGIRAGVDAVNRVKVVFEAGSATLVVNDSTIVQVRRVQPPSAGGSVGLYAESEEDRQNEWHFLKIAVLDDNRPEAAPSTVESTPVASACKAVSPTTFSDDFTSPDPGWGKAGSEYYFSGGRMVLKPKANTNLAWIYRPLVFDSTAVCVEVKSPEKISKSQDIAAGGLIFWATDYQNYYMAAIFTDGTYSVRRKIADKWFTVVPRTPADSIRPGFDAVNQMTVVAAASRATLYINDTKIVGFWGQAPNKGGAIGLYGQSESEQENEWRFLNIAVTDATQPKAGYPPGAREAANACTAKLSPAFFDDFTMPDPGWGSTGATYFFRESRMVLKPKRSTTEPWIYTPLVFNSATICAEITSPAQLGEADDASSAGIIFWASDYKNYHVAQLYPNGTYSVWRKIDGEWATVIPRSAANAIHQGKDAVNRIKVVLDHDSVTIVLNDAAVIAFHGQPREAGGAIGLYGESSKGSESEWRFANLVVID